MSIRPFRDIKRKKTKKITVGKVEIGGDAPISVQSMTNTLTTDVEATIKQINSSISLRKRYEKAKSKQDKRIKHKWSVIESTILSDHREAEKFCRGSFLFLDL